MTGPVDQRPGPAQPRIQVLTRVGCHLCDDAVDTVAAVAAAAGVGWVATDVDGDPDLRAEYGDLVPVVLVDGVEAGYHRIDPAVLADRLRTAPAG